MIVGDLKPLEEIADSVAIYRNVLVLGCGGCVTVCRSGGNADGLDGRAEHAGPGGVHCQVRGR